MDDFIVILLLGVIFLILGPVAFVMALVQRVKVRDLREQVQGLEQAVYGMREQLFSTVDRSDPVSETTETSISSDPVMSPKVEPSEAKDEAALPPIPEPAIGATVSTDIPKPVAAAPPSRDGFEKKLAQNWMIWLGGLAIAIGGLFMVRVAIDAGMFGPLARVIMATCLGAGLVVGGLLSDRWSWVREGEGMVARLPEVISAAGVTTLYGATIGAGFLYGFVPPLVALGLFAAVSALAVMLALKYGLLLAALGFAGAFVGPVLTGSPGGDVVPLLPYFGVVTLAGMYLVKRCEWRFLTWLLLIGAGAWGLVAIGSLEGARYWAVPAYALTIGAAGLLLGERGARTQGETLFVNPFKDVQSEGVFAAFGFWIVAGGLILLTGLTALPSQGSSQHVVTLALALFGGMGLLATWKRVGYALIAPVSAIVSMIALMIWPSSLADVSATPIAFAIGFGLLGTVLMMRAQKEQAALAFVAALAPPVMLFVAFWRGGLEPDFMWGLGAAMLALCLGAVLEWIGRQKGGHDARPGQTIAYALGAGLSAILAPFLVLHGIWLSPTLIVVSAMLVLVWRRFPYEPLRIATLAALAGGVFLMMRPGLLYRASLNEMPIVNEITGLFGIAIGAALVARWIVRDVPVFARSFEGASWILAFGWIGLTIRHIAGGGDLNAGPMGLGESSAYAISYLGAAMSLVWRSKSPGIWMRVIETLALALGIGAMVLVFDVTVEQIASATGNEIYREILLLAIPAWLMPTVLMAGIAAGWRRRGYANLPTFAACVSMLFGFVWVTIETICLFEVLHFNDDGMWLFSATWILYAFLLLGLAIWRGSTAVRFGSLAVLILSILKVFLFDLSNLDGVARAGSFIGLGVALILAALFYQRFVFRKPMRVETLEDGA